MNVKIIESLLEDESFLVIVATTIEVIDRVVKCKCSHENNEF